MLRLLRRLGYTAGSHPIFSCPAAHSGAVCFPITTPVMIAVRLRSTPEAKAAKVVNRQRLKL